LASGSKGNSLYVETGDCRLLIDAGLSARQTINRLRDIGVDGAELDAIIISHEHIDHIRGADLLSQKLKIPLVMSYPTAAACRPGFATGNIIEFESGYPFAFKDLLVDPFPTTHDACDPVGFVIESRDGRVGVATDFGVVTRLVAEKLQRCRAVVIESNHDEGMLRDGPYPWHLKQRIRSRHGHLSNDQAGALLEALLHPGLEGVFLAHLSEANNDPMVARQVAEALLQGQNACSPSLFVGTQHQRSEVLALS
jgi:phosphoribosyl 1,2-cyclic phosphodiesterase